MRHGSFLILALALSVGCFVKPEDSGAVDDTGTAGPVDADADGHDETVDCDDADPAVYPGADEYCNGIDDDCDDEVDEDAIDATAWLPDADNDGYGDRNTAKALAACAQPTGLVADATDCDDGDAEVNPGADEYCNGIDDDCDGDIDVDAIDAATWYLDYDADGYGGTSYTEIACEPSSGYVADDTDCDDLEVATHPGADEDPCNEVDDDCDGEVDEHDAAATPWYEDMDGDGWGNSAVVQEQHPDCAQPSGYVASAGDCDESDATVNPGADEYCDGTDNDCDGGVDEDDALDTLSWYEDADGDFYGWFYDPATLACTAPSGFVADNTDCNDGDAAVYPGTSDCNWGTIGAVQTGIIPDGAPVTVVGWVMHDAISTGFHLADASGAYNGVWVYTNKSTMLEGDEVVLFGTVAEYFDLTEIVVAAPSTDIIVLDTAATLPGATAVTTADLADTAIAEAYEGVLVTVSGVTIDDSDLGYGEWSVDDGVTIDDLLYTPVDDLAEGGTYSSITGLLYYSYGVYKLLPRYAADLVGYATPLCAADFCVNDLVVGDLIITELMFNPAACSDNYCEWVEVYNASGGSVDLNGLIVEDAGANTATITGSAVMAAGSNILLAVGDSSTWGYTGFTPDGYYGSSVAFGNTGDQVMIANSAGYLDASPAYTSGVSSAGYSWNLEPAATDVALNDDPGWWCEATSAIGSTGDYGTPGASNDVCP